MSKYKFNISVEMYEDDLKALFTKCGSNEVTIEEVVTDFLNNLVYGRCRRGSDECERANSYFDRCLYNLISEGHFLSWLLDTGNESYFDDLHTDYKIALAETEPDEEEVNAYKEELEALYKEYVEDVSRYKYADVQSMEEAFKTADEWLTEKCFIINEADITEE